MIASLTIGFGAGLLHLFGLHRTVEKLAVAQKPKTVMRWSFALRSALTVALLYFLCPSVPLGVLGWWLARNLVLSWN